MDNGFGLALSVDIVAQGTKQAGEVGRAAGALEPGLPVVMAFAFQGVVIEEVVTIFGDGAQDAIIKRQFKGISIAPVTIQLEQPLGPKDQANGGACFGIGAFV